MEIATDDGIAVVPIEDLNQIMVHGANIRLSTMDLSILSQNKVALMTEYNCYKLEGKGNDVTVTCIHKGYAKEYENIIVKNIIK